MKNKVKLTGERSIESKLMRLAWELERDASRVREDHPDRDNLANALADISRRLGRVGRNIGSA